MERSLEAFIYKDLNKKIVLLSGPRQVGKTTLAKSLFPKHTTYLNMDYPSDRRTFAKMDWERNCELVVFDELHKIRKWKNSIKGVYDKEGVRPRLLVTGSARLDAWRKGGDSLAGRFFSYRMHPFSVAELRGKVSAQEALKIILRTGGFPEPFLAGSAAAAKRWRQSHLDRILREDLRDLTLVRDQKGIETLVEFLRQSVSSMISYDSLARDLQVSAHTIKNWISLLESLYVLFVVTPYSRNIRRGLLKQPKIYFYDTGFVCEDPGARLENAVACALIKRLHFLEDTLGEKCSLHYVRDKEKRETDFLTVREGAGEFLIETKVSDPDIKAIRHFSHMLGPKIQPFVLLQNLNAERRFENIKICNAAAWLQELEA